MKSIRSLVFLALGIIILVFLAQAVLVWTTQNKVKNDVVQATTKNTLASADLNELAILAQQVRRYEKEYFVYVSVEERRNTYIKEWTGTYDKITALVQKIRNNNQGAFSKDDLDKVGAWDEAASFYGSEMKKIFSAVNQRATDVSVAAGTPAPTGKDAAPVAPVVMYSPTEVNTMIGPGKDKLSGVLIKGVSELNKAKTQATLGLSDVAAKGFQQLLMGVLATVGVGILASLALLAWLPGAVTKPVAQFSAVVDALSKGEVDKPIAGAQAAEFAGLAKALERLRVAQQAMVQRLRSR
jgi:methyl-accepting chemotaxis protein